jgi:glycine/D-amino acid oxidase-like deaminating enzyme
MRLRGMPFSFFSDAFPLSFTENEIKAKPTLAELQGQTLSGHFHARDNWDDAIGEPSIQALWTYDSCPELSVRETVPVEYATILKKGLQKLFPDYQLSSEALSKVKIYTGIYTKMPDNMPCIGTLISGRVYINSALSGFGYMFSQQASKLVSHHCVDAEPIPNIFNPLRQYNNVNTHLRGQM